MSFKRIPLCTEQRYSSSNKTCQGNHEWFEGVGEEKLTTCTCNRHRRNRVVTHSQAKAHTSSLNRPDSHRKPNPVFPVHPSTYPKKVPRWAVHKSAVLDLRLRSEVFRWINIRHHSLDGQKGCQIGSIRRDEYKREEPPDGTDDTTRNRPRWYVAALLHKCAQRKPQRVHYAELIHGRMMSDGRLSTRNASTSDCRRHLLENFACNRQAQCLCI